MSPAVLGEDPYVQNRLLVLYPKDDLIGKFIIGYELLDTILIDKVSLLTHFLLAKLQSIKTSHRSCIKIPRSLERQYSPDASSSGNKASASALGLTLTLNYHASCLFLCECKKFVRIDCIILKS
jgi:hypothetical protein